MANITLLGAGSTIFAKTLIGDILSYPELQESTIVLMDLDEQRLRTSEIVAHKIAATLNVNPKIVSTLNRQQALENSDYVINLIQVGGYKPATVTDFEIPQKYGLQQTIADTIGIGGIMRGLRTIPVLLDICKDMENLCADALLINYANPMAMNCLAMNRFSKIKTIGLCHSVQGTAMELAKDIGIPYEEINYLCAGINHMAFYLRFERNGENLYPLIRKVIEENRIAHWNRVRYDIFKRLGYFVTESSEHFAEYVPYYIKQHYSHLIEKYNIPLDEYIRRCEQQIADWEQMRIKLESHEPIEVKRSKEYGVQIIHSMETGTPVIVYGNVLNTGLISNLPPDCCVEVPCVVDKNGSQPVVIGNLPLHLAALMRTNVNVHQLTVEAILQRKRAQVYHAAMLDPHTAAELTLDEIWSLVDELIEAHGDWIPQLD